MAVEQLYDTLWGRLSLSDWEADQIRSMGFPAVLVGPGNPPPPTFDPIRTINNKVPSVGGNIDITPADVGLYLTATGNGSADDTAAIQATLDAVKAAGGGRVRGFPGRTYLISAPLVVGSGTTLDMTNCTIRLKAGSNCNMLQNAAAYPARTVTDGVTTAGSTTVTSATASFAAADVGKAVGVLTAGPNYGLSSAPGSLYGTITAVNSPTSVTLSQPATFARTGATLSVFPARDSNITVLGGTWNAGNRDAVYQSLDGHSMRLRRCDGVTIRGQKMTSTTSGGIGGGRYAISLGDVTNVEVAEITFDTAGDGVHTAGPAQRISIHDVFGRTGDDMVAFTGVDGQTQPNSLLGDVEGSITDVTVHNVHCNNAWSALKITSGIGTNNQGRQVSSFHARDITGTTNQPPIGIVDYAGTTNFDGEINGVSCYSLVAGTPVVNLSAGLAQNVRLRDVVWPSAAGCPTGGVIQLNATVKALSVDTLIVRGIAAGTGVGILLKSSPTALMLSNLIVPDNPPTFHGISLTTPNIVITQCAITQVQRIAQGGNLINVDTNGGSFQFLNLHISNGYQSAGSVLATVVDSAQASKVRISNWRQPAGALVLAQNPVEVNLSNVEIAPSAGAVRANSAAATPVRVRGSNLVVTSGALLSRTASQAISANGLTCAADVSILTPSAGDVAFNTNSALACGVGPVVTDGTTWKHLHTGLTY